MAADKKNYFNRELSWLQFNMRVLHEAYNPATPLLEKLKFLAITASNLDEFFMVRVGGLHTACKGGHRRRDISGLTPHRQLQAIQRKAREMNRYEYNCFNTIIEPELMAAGIERVTIEKLNLGQHNFIFDLFNEELLSCLTPIRLTAHFRPPLIHSLALYCAVRMQGDDEKSDGLALIALQPEERRIIDLPTQRGYQFILIEDIVKTNIKLWFPGQKVKECVCFRITRNADMTVQEDEAPDLLSGMEEVLEERKISDCIRLEVEAAASGTIVKMLQNLVTADNSQTYLQDGPIDLKAFMALTGLSGFEHLKFEVWPPLPNPMVDSKSALIPQIRECDILLHHPYESFDPVVRFLEEASSDPSVIAIKQVLYRTSRNSPIVNALKKAARRGKAVTVLVELKARFDEERNIEEAAELELAGAQVIYGVKGFKTHAKICLVVRREHCGIVRYAHFGTGNYNDVTARIYGDIGLLTCNEDLCADAAAFFNIIGAHTQPRPMRKAVMAPLYLRDRLIELIDLEIEMHRKGNRGHISAKMNSLVDQVLIDKLYEASCAGVKIDLNVRGICCLVPGVKGVSENIKVTSIVGRYLEHARIFCFRHGGNDKVYIASADWMPRNLDRRFELMIPIESEFCRHKVLEIVKVYLSDSEKSSILGSDGEYMPVRDRGGKAINAQEFFYRQACELSTQAARRRATRFEPHRPAT
jgi:polyphosphate kinase